MIAAMEIEALIGSLRELLAIAVFAAVSAVLASVRNWVQSRVKDDGWRGANDRLERLVTDAIDDVEQTFVRPAKAGPTDWSEDHKAEAAKLAMTRVVRDLGERGVQDTAARLGVDQAGVESRIRTLIEAAVSRRKPART